MPSFPSDALAPNGQLWWDLETIPGGRQRFGATKRLASWIHFNMELSSTVTMRELRAAVRNSGEPNTDEHFNRRFRELRDAGWKLTSNKEDSSLGRDEYRLVTRGLKIWINGVNPDRQKLSDRIRRQVLERDKRICQVCFIAAGEEYADDPGSRARMTVGHIRANALNGDAELLNLRAECARCNEPLRDEASSGHGIEVVWPSVRRLSRVDKSILLSWFEEGKRPSTEVIMIFDRVAELSSAEKIEIVDRLREAS